MMTKRRNSLVALLLVVSMVISMIPASSIKAAETLPTEGFNEVTPEMFGIEDYADNTSQTTKYGTLAPITTANKMLFKANMVMGSSSIISLFNVGEDDIEGTGIEFTGSANGFRVYNRCGAYQYFFVDNDSSTKWYYDISLGVELDTTEIELAITTELVDYDQDGNANDLKVGIWFGGVLYNETYLYFQNCDIGQEDMFFATNAKSLTSPEVIVSPEPEPSVPTIPNDFVQVTPREFGIQDYANNDSNVTKYGTICPRSTADKMVFKANILMGSGTVLRLFNTSGDLDTESGIVFWVNTSSFRMVNRCSAGNPFYVDGSSDAQWYYDINLGVDVTTTAINLAVTTEFMDYDNDGQKDDMKIGVWIDETLYNNVYFYFTDCYVDAEEDISFTTDAKAVTSPAPKTDGVVEVTPKMFGIEDFTGNTGTEYVSTVRPVRSADKMVFKANVVFGNAWQDIKFFDMSGSAVPTSGHGFSICRSFGTSAMRLYNNISTIWAGGEIVNGVYSGGTQLTTTYVDITPGVDVSVTENELVVTIDYVNIDNNGVTDLKVGVFINGNLADNRYLYLTDFAIGQSNIALIATVNSISSPKVLEVPEALRPITLPEDFEQVTLESFGIDDYTNNTSKTMYTSTLKPITSSDKMLFKANVVFGEGGITLFDRSGTGATSYGLCLEYRGGKLALYNMNGAGVHYGYNIGEYVDGAFTGGFAYFYTIDPGVTLASTELEVAITTETVDVNQDGTDDTKVGVWFGGNLYNDTYVYIVGETFDRDNVFAATNVLSLTSPELPAPPSLPTDFNEVTPGDFGIADFAENTAQTLHQSTVAPITSADEMLFKASVVFGEGEDRGFWFFDATGEEDNRSSFGLFTQADGSLRLSNYYNGNTIWVGDKYVESTSNGAWINYEYDIYPTVNLADTEVELAITTEVVDFDKDDNDDDLKMGIWINGALYNKKYFYVRDCAIASENIYLDTNVLSLESPYTYTVQMDVTDSLAMNYIVKMNGTVSNPQMSFTMNGRNKVVQGVAVAGAANTYKFTFANIMAQEMAANIEATLTVGSRTETKNYSVLDYCAGLLLAEAMYADDGTAYTEGQIKAAKEIVVDLVQYGAEAQTYQGITGEDLFTAKLATKVENYRDFDNADKTVASLANLTAVEDKLTSEEGIAASSAYAWQSVGLVLGNKVKIRGTFTASDISNLTIKVVVGGVELDGALEIKAASEANTYTVDFDEIYAYEYGKEISFRFYDGATQVGNTLNYSVNTYLKEMSTYSDGLLAQLLVAISNYGDAAIAVENQEQ